MSVADDECEIEIEENPWEPLMSMADDYEEDPSEDETQSSMGSCPSTGLIVNCNYSLSRDNTTSIVLFRFYYVYIYIYLCAILLPNICNYFK